MISKARNNELLNENGIWKKVNFRAQKEQFIPLIRAPQFFIGQENIANWRNLWLSRHRHHRLAIKAVEFLSASGSGRSARPLMGAGLSTFSSPKIIFMDKWGLSRVEGPPKYADEAWQSDARGKVIWKCASRFDHCWTDQMGFRCFYCQR